MISIRQAEPKDLPTILEIYNEIIVHTTAVYDNTPHTIQMRTAWFEAKKAENFPVYVAIHNDEVCGFSSIGPFRNWAAYKYTVENSVYVDTRFRGRGIGKMLMIPLIQAAKERNMHAVVAGIDATNSASLHLHQVFGFQQVAHFKQVGYKFGKWLDLIFMELLL